MKRIVFRNRWLPYALVAPQVVITIAFFYWPAFDSLRLSLYRASPFGDRLIWAGLANFERLFRDPAYLRSALTSLVFSFVVTFAGLALALLLASLANAKIRGLAIYRTLLLWPYGIAPAVAGVIWMFVFHPSFGVLPYLLSFVTAYQFNWFLKGWVALVLIVVAAIWKQFGYNLAFYLAGLQAIPGSVLEAASVDGAGPIRRFFAITFPLLSPVTFFLFTLNMTFSFFDTFGLVHAVTQGGPGDERRDRPRDTRRLGGRAGLSALLRVRDQHPDARRGDEPSAEARALDPHAAELRGCLGAGEDGPASPEQRDRRARGRVREDRDLAPVRVRDRLLQLPWQAGRLLDDLHHPDAAGAGADRLHVSGRQRPWLGRHLLGAHGPAAGVGHRHVPVPPVLPDHPGLARRGGAARRRRPAALPVVVPAAAVEGQHRRALRHPLRIRLERLPVAADRDEQPGDAHRRDRDRFADPADLAAAGMERGHGGGDDGAAPARRRDRRD